MFAGDLLDRDKGYYAHGHKSAGLSAWTLSAKNRPMETEIGAGFRTDFFRAAFSVAKKKPVPWKTVITIAGDMLLDHVGQIINYKK